VTSVTLAITDRGGPLHKFLCLGFYHAFCMMLSACIFVALRDGDYLYVGQFIAVSLVHGGPGPACLSNHLYAAISENRSLQTATIDDLPPGELTERIKQVVISAPTICANEAFSIPFAWHIGALQVQYTYIHTNILKSQLKISL